MFTIYTKTYNEESVLENSRRITIPVKYLIQNGIKLLSSESLSNNDISLLIKYNSQDYIKKILIGSDLTSCNYCSSINPIEEEYCHMCSNKFNKEIRLYMDNDTDTLITLNTIKELEEVCKVLNFLIGNFEKYNYAYALIRPPGHHAYTNHHEGFCIVNNAFILASELIQQKKSSRVLIYDWDLHHGNGTQECVLRNEQKDIFFVSTHFYARGFYPGTGGDYLYNPSEPINSNVYNFPLNKSNTKNFSEYFKDNIISLLDKLCGVVDTIIISNGLDAHKEDPFNKLTFTDDDYVYMSEYFKSKNKKIIFVLEGGYKPEIIARVSLKIIKLFE